MKTDHSQSGEKLDNPEGNQDNQGFTGHIQDNTTGLTYMQARYYDPVTGRFLSIDPVQFSANMPFMFNRYAYVGGDPVNATDPDGEFINFVVGAAIGAVAEAGLQIAKGINEGKSFKESVKSIDPSKVVANAAVGALTGGASAFAKTAIVGTTKAVTTAGSKKIAETVSVKGAERVAAGAISVELSAGAGVLSETVDAKGDSRNFSPERAVAKIAAAVVTSPVNLGSVATEAVEQVYDEKEVTE